MAVAVKLLGIRCRLAVAAALLLASCSIFLIIKRLRITFLLNCQYLHGERDREDVAVSLDVESSLLGGSEACFPSARTLF